MANFNERLKQAMKLKNITQTELCEKTGIPKSAMSQYVSGAFTPKQERTYLIAKALNVNESWLLGFDDVPMDKEHKILFTSTGGMIKYYRNCKGISQKELAALIEKDILDVQNYESDITEPSDETLIKISNILELNEKMVIAFKAMFKAFYGFKDLGKAAHKINPEYDKNIEEIFFILKKFVNIDDNEEKQEFLYVIDKYSELNEKGRQKLIEYITDLSEQHKYSKFV